MSTKQYDSMAGTSAQYFGNESFRIRKNNGNVRLHLSKTNLRNREKYVAIDFSNRDFVEALKAAGLVKVAEVTRTITETVMVPQEVTKEVTELAVVAG